MSEYLIFKVIAFQKHFHHLALLFFFLNLDLRGGIMNVYIEYFIQRLYLFNSYASSNQ